jgi:hypothetical protein
MEVSKIGEVGEHLYGAPEKQEFGRAIKALPYHCFLVRIAALFDESNQLRAIPSNAVATAKGKTKAAKVDQ